MEDILFAEIEALYEEMVKTRRFLHQYPELSFQETKTSAFIQEQYQLLDIPFQANVGGNGVVATLTGSKPGKTVALRADFDALPIQDDKDVPYKSKYPNVMHACGHDGHTAVLLAIANALKKHQDQLAGQVVFIHQHAEEVAPGGAKPIIESGILDNVDVVYGTHLWTSTPYGVIETAPGNFMAAADRFVIKLKGAGGHGAIPHQTKDPIVAGSQLTVSLQQIVSRRVDPLETAVVSIGKFHAGNAYNVIPETGHLEGTVRTFNPDIQQFIREEIETITRGVCLANGMDYTYDYLYGYPPVVNHQPYAEKILQAAQQIKEVDKVQMIKPSMTGEDFAYYLQEKPGAFFFTGAQIDNGFVPHHHPLFDFDERAMMIAAKTLIAATLNENK
ncbi:M20 metallopeptidase family protein [Gracilibacillus alcaliphilus]|uniref:M20 metallopeptidase family protein n=1 Tax=Gracilibacillus alcaliphilus TaxID=1401441 RepID=UPI00195970FE|nr:amidohydrolase [Gracilibacillus alcaliphilus]MBM7675409.1 amidohydrolase [Gracilibacillus alcaliphilus]